MKVRNDSRKRNNNCTKDVNITNGAENAKNISLTGPLLFILRKRIFDLADSHCQVYTILQVSSSEFDLETGYRN
jgi:hypothetical protein